MAEVTIQNVSKIYEGGVTAVDNVSFTVKDGEFMVLVGPSGCGKSTTLRMVAGLEDISRGTITIGERIVNAVPPKDRDIAMVFQNYALYPHMTVRDNMAFGLQLRGFPRSEIARRVEAASQILGLDTYLERLPKALSGGQRQRVAMGRAIVRNPAVFLFDEPLSNLDAKMRVEMRREILSLHKRLKCTMIYVTHDQVEAMTLGNRICIMHDGIIEQIGTPMEVFARPTNLFVARFIGTPPMNTIEGILARDGTGFYFVAEGDIRLRLPAEWTPRIEPFTGKAIALGIRPRALTVLDDTTQPHDQRLAGRLEVREILGEDALLYIAAGKNKFIVNSDPMRHFHDDSIIAVSIDYAQAHIFDIESGRNISQ